MRVLPTLWNKREDSQGNSPDKRPDHCDCLRTLVDEGQIYYHEQDLSWSELLFFHPTDKLTALVANPSAKPIKQTAVSRAWKSFVTPAQSVPIVITRVASKNTVLLPTASVSGIHTNAPMPMNSVGPETKISIPKGAIFCFRQPMGLCTFLFSLRHNIHFSLT